MGPRIPDNLIESISEGKCILVAGAGLSANSGLPDWDTLFSKIRTELKPPEWADLTDLAQVYEAQYGRQSLLAIIQKKLNQPNIVPAPHHHLIAALGFPEIITTNYDDLIEQALYAGGVYRDPAIVDDSDLSYRRHDQTTVIKLHGDLSKKESIVATRQDTLNFAIRCPLLKQTVTSIFSDKTILFLGYSLRDINVLQLQCEVMSRLLSHQRSSYAIFPEVGSFEKYYLTTFNIKPICLNNWPGISISDRLFSFLNNLYTGVTANLGVTRYTYRNEDANKTVPSDVMSKWTRDGYVLVGCVEFLVFIPIIDAGQPLFIPPRWHPYAAWEEQENAVQTNYSRTGDDGSFFYGIAFFSPANKK